VASPSRDGRGLLRAAYKRHRERKTVHQEIIPQKGLRLIPRHLSLSSTHLIAWSLSRIFLHKGTAVHLKSEFLSRNCLRKQPARSVGHSRRERRASFSESRPDPVGLRQTPAGWHRYGYERSLACRSRTQTPVKSFLKPTHSIRH
jgi:hypothetical protein